MFHRLRRWRLDPFTIPSRSQHFILIVVLSVAIPVSSGSRDEFFREHPDARVKYGKLRELGGLYGWKWITALSKLTKTCHPVDESGLAHLALELVNIRREFLSRGTYSCDPKAHIFHCKELRLMPKDALELFAQMFVELHIVCTSVAHGPRVEGVQETLRTIADLQSNLGRDLMKFKESTDDLISTEILEVRKLGPLVVRMIQSIGTMENSVNEALGKGLYSVAFFYILVTFVTLLATTHVLTLGKLLPVRQACFCLAFSNFFIELQCAQLVTPSGDASFLIKIVTYCTAFHGLLMVIAIFLNPWFPKYVKRKKLSELNDQLIVLSDLMQSLDL